MIDIAKGKVKGIIFQKRQKRAKYLSKMMR